MTETTLNVNNYIDICSIPSKFHMCMYERMKNIYAQNQSSIHCPCVWKAVHNRTFWIILVICACRVPKPQQWSLGKVANLKCQIFICIWMVSLCCRHSHRMQIFKQETLAPPKHKFLSILSILLTKLLIKHIKQGLQKYCGTAYSKNGVNQMWILKNSKELLEHLKSPNFNHITSIKSFDFSTFYSTLPHDKLKSRLATTILNSFIFKNGNR